MGSREYGMILEIQRRLKHLNTQCVRQRDRLLSGPELPHCCASLAGILTLLNADTFKQFKFQMPEEQAFGVLVEMMHAYSLRDLFRWQGMKLSKYSMRKTKKLTLRALRKKSILLQSMAVSQSVETVTIST